MLERPAFLDHPELQRRPVVLQGNATGLREHDHEERGRGKQVRGLHDLRRRRLQRRREHVRQVRLRDQRDGEDDEQDRRLAERAEGAQAARSELGVRAAAVDRRQRDGVAREAEDQTAAEDVAHEGALRRKARQHRDQQRDDAVTGKGDIRRRAEHRSRSVREHGLLPEQLRDVVVGLQQPRPAAHLHDRLSARDHPGDERREDEDRPKLQNLDQPIAQLWHRPDGLPRRTVRRG